MMKRQVYLPQSTSGLSGGLPGFFNFIYLISLFFFGHFFWLFPGDLSAFAITTSQKISKNECKSRNGVIKKYMKYIAAVQLCDQNVTIKLLTFPEGVELATAFKHGFVGRLCQVWSFLVRKIFKNMGKKAKTNHQTKKNTVWLLLISTSLHFLGLARYATSPCIPRPALSVAFPRFVQAQALDDNARGNFS